MAGIPMLVLFNKIDSSDSEKVEMFAQGFGFGGNRRPVSSQLCSAITGKGLDGLVQWMCDPSVIRT